MASSNRPLQPTHPFRVNPHPPSLIPTIHLLNPPSSTPFLLSRKQTNTHIHLVLTYTHPPGPNLHTSTWS